MVVATLVLAVGNADAARNWSEGLHPNPLSLKVRDACERWAAFTKATRLSAARDAVRGAWDHRHAVSWSVIGGGRVAPQPGSAGRPDQR
jgi:hypothetical protein